MIRHFINRHKELQVLEKEWDKPTASLIIVYGRRRIGKTRLLSEFTRDKSGVLFFAEDTAPRVQIEGLKTLISQYLQDPLLADLPIYTWSQLFDYLSSHQPNQRSYLIIDEFSYLIKSDQSVLSAIQKAWDMRLSASPWVIILTGSLLGLMSDAALSHTSPLYGRRDRDILLKSLPFSEAKKFLQGSFETCLQMYFIIGGIPEYLNRAGEYSDIDAFTSNEFYDMFGYFYREPYFLLSQEFRELKIYQSILGSLASGRTTPSEIATSIGLDTRNLYPYLESMIRLGFVEKESSIIGSPKKSIYRISDSLLDFWYTFVFPNRRFIELSHPLTPAHTHFFGRKFEVFIREEVISRLYPGQDAGRWWHKEEEIDCIVFDSRNHSVVFCECKYSRLTLSKAYQVLHTLEKKAELVPFDMNVWKSKKFCLFVRNVEEKEKLMKERYLVYDIRDIEKLYSDA
ncbi:ATP-binding protein [Methanospirillum hungatei]|uniref:ATP-binding protein n=1 Tax=Methanospirillum hungatei TaxID=2203 RepID=UPI0026F0B4C3|nr:ATP-binding protein [Methanospirillum hungatei]MCA1915243.1 ATP-binding protein [Methanospirillum hungatei]